MVGTRPSSLWVKEGVEPSEGTFEAPSCRSLREIERGGKSGEGLIVKAVDDDNSAFDGREMGESSIEVGKNSIPFGIGRDGGVG